MKLAKIALSVALATATSMASEYRMDEKTRSRALVDSYRYDLRPGMRLTCRVKFDVSAEEKGEMVVVRKGHVNSPGAYLLRVDGPKEGVKFSFFVNHEGTPEPRVSVPVKPVPGEWYDVAAGWDGTNSWLTVNGQTATKRRPGPQSPLGCDGDLAMGPMYGTVADVSVTGPDVKRPADTSYCAGFHIACQATFLVPPAGETPIACKKNEYWLR